MEWSRFVPTKPPQHASFKKKITALEIGKACIVHLYLLYYWKPLQNKLKVLKTTNSSSKTRHAKLVPELIPKIRGNQPQYAVHPVTGPTNSLHYRYSNN